MWYLCVFYHRLLDFRRPEVESLAELFGATGKSTGQKFLQWRLPEHCHTDSPFHFVSLPCEDIARRIANRSVLVKGIYELWGEGTTYGELEKSIKCYPEERKLPYLATQATFKIIFDSFGKAVTFHDQNERIERLSFIPFQGRVDLRNPDHKFWLIETGENEMNNGLPETVSKRYFFGREVGSSDRKVLPAFELKRRCYIGPTTMDAEVAFLMANQGLASHGNLIFDPFTGTGSILVATSHFGAMTMGADIDIRAIRDGRGPECNVWSNFKQYGLPMPISLVRADNNVPPWRCGLEEVFDSIICDPPYGVRAGGRKSGGRKLLKGCVAPYTIPQEKRAGHIPSTGAYSLSECVHDLLDLAARMLVPRGRLVFFYPLQRDDSADDATLPEHPCFETVAVSEQILSSRYSRALLTMVKTGRYTREINEEARRKHSEFRETHAAGPLRSAVFTPTPPLPVPLRAKYRGKYV